MPGTVDPFTNIPYIPLPTAGNERAGGTFLSDLRELQVGQGGANIFRADKDGIFLGGKTFATAPFSVTMQGALVASSITATGAIITGVGSSIDGQYLTSASVTGTAIANATITATQIANATITATEIANATITAVQISATAGITGNQIANATITATQIANATITATEIANATITGTQIATGTITSGNIQNATIVGGDISLATITGSNIVNATITTTQVSATAGLTGSQLANNTITATQIANATITTTQISGTAGITGTQIANNTITADQIANATITGTQVANATIEAANITNATITATQIANGTITSVEIANATIIATNISDTAGILGSQLSAIAGIVGTQIANTTISGGNLINNTLTATQIAVGAITGACIANTTITGGNLVNNTITATQIANATITGTQIAGTTIAGSNVINNTITVGKLNLPSHLIIGTFTNDSPGAGSVAWSGITLDYNGTTYSIDAGNTADKYIWWDHSLSTTTFQTSATLPTLENADCLIGLNNFGTYQSVWNASGVNGSIIENASIAGGSIENTTISGDNMINNTITATQIANATITGTQIAATTVAGANIVNNTITATQIQNATITTTQIALATITAANIAGATITATQIANATITATQIANTTITATQIANATITTTQISGTAGITGTQIANATITGSNIANTTITAANIANATITATQLANTTITATQIANLTITAAQIANLTITSGKISSINADKINVGTLTGFTIQTASTGKRIKMTSSPQNRISFLDGAVEKGYLEIADDGDGGYYLNLGGPGGLLQIGSTVGAAGLEYANMPWFTGTGKASSGQVILEGSPNYVTKVGLEWSGGSVGTFSLNLGTYLAKISSDLVPSAAGYDLGGSAAANKWQNAYFSGTIRASYLNLANSLCMNSSSSTDKLYPEYSNTIDLGKSGNNFSYLYVNYCANHFRPTATTLNLGDASYYWNNIYYKTLVKSGGFGFLDRGVKLQDGRTVSDLEAISQFTEDSSKKTPYGSNIIDHKTLPEIVYCPARDPETGKLMLRDKNNRPYQYVIDDKTKKMKKVFAEDGEDVNAMISIMIGSIKELNNKIEFLKQKVG